MPYVISAKIFHETQRGKASPWAQTQYVTACHAAEINQMQSTKEIRTEQHEGERAAEKGEYNSLKKLFLSHFPNRWRFKALLSEVKPPLIFTWGFQLVLPLGPVAAIYETHTFRRFLIQETSAGFPVFCCFFFYQESLTKEGICSVLLLQKENNLINFLKHICVKRGEKIDRERVATTNLPLHQGTQGNQELQKDRAGPAHRRIQTVISTVHLKDVV